MYMNRRGHLDVVKCLVNEGHCDPDIKDKSGGTPIYGACRYIVLYVHFKGCLVLPQPVL